MRNDAVFVIKRILSVCEGYPMEFLIDDILFIIPLKKISYHIKYRIHMRIIIRTIYALSIVLRQPKS